MDGRVLVVDDHEDTVMLYAEELRAAGFDVSTATSPDEAMSLALTFRPDAVVLDIAMPTMDGYELARLIRSYAATRHARLVAVSAHPFDFSPAQLPPGGWDACLCKPCESGPLVGVITALLSAKNRHGSGPVAMEEAPTSRTGGD